MNTPHKDTYHLVSKILHWVTALLIFGLLSMGFFMADLPFSEDKFKIYALHKSFGLLVLLLVFIRVAWHILKQKPKPLSTHKPWEHALAHGVHLFLYFSLFAMPISGWIMSSAGDFTVGFFGLPIPDLVGKDEAVFETAKDVHEILAILLIIFVGLHMAGAFKHHFIDRDRTLMRMTREGLGFVGGAALVVIAGALMMPPLYFAAKDVLEPEAEIENVERTTESVAVQDGGWVIDPAASTIAFEATQYKQAFTGRFESFGGVIVFDPADLMSARAEIDIDIASIRTGAADRDMQAVGAEWFDTANHPMARFVTRSFKKTAENQYLAKGDLTIRGVSVPVDLLFDLTIDEKDGKKRAVMRAALPLKRLDFGIGQGQWQNTDAIGDEVKITIEVTATQ